ncbi:hypothetical protein MTR67_035592 [Solanum verrucosum]|uniref:Diacylglycerol glucosyltransferase N-terminal domain-containing protein n=1 Tax=Solanum verrucosum TaxID=315347 RepID=A0AAF0UA62_SOLVR|nr:hypothetical protein MTR67_035592 [Solanum verrucosum]
MDESMSTFDIVRSLEVEYVDDHESTAVDSIEKKAKIVNIDNNLVDPQLCATMTYDIHNHLRASKTTTTVAWSILRDDRIVRNYLLTLYCLENLFLDFQGNLKVSDFGHLLKSLIGGREGLGARGLEAGRGGGGPQGTTVPQGGVGGTQATMVPRGWVVGGLGGRRCLEVGSSGHNGGGPRCMTVPRGGRALVHVGALGRWGLSARWCLGVAKDIMKYQPDIIISVHPLMQHVSLRLLRFHKLVTRCYYPSEEVARRALKVGLQPSQIKDFGLPVRPSFVKHVCPKVRVKNFDKENEGVIEYVDTCMMVSAG